MDQARVTSAILAGWLTVLGMTMIIAPYKSGGIKTGLPVFGRRCSPPLAPALLLLTGTARCLLPAAAAAAVSTPRARPLRNL